MEIGPIGFGPATFWLRTGRSNRLSHAQRLLCLSSSHLRRFVPNQREVSRTASEIQRLANSVSGAPPEGAEATAVRRTVSVGDAINQKASDSSAVVRSSRLSRDGCEHKISIRPRADADARAPSSNSITGVMATVVFCARWRDFPRDFEAVFGGIQSACSSSGQGHSVPACLSNGTERPARLNIANLLRKKWSGRVDSNHRPLGPEPSALPG